MKSVKNKIINCGKRLYQQGYLAGADGNISIRIKNRIYITSSGCGKGFLTEKNISEVSLNGTVLKGKPSTELQMHLEVYRSCAKAKAVIHAHPPLAIAWSLCNIKNKYIPSESLPEIILTTGEIPVISYTRPGTKEMGLKLKSFFPKHRIFLLSRHGGLSWGESMEEAFWGIERLDHISKILIHSQGRTDLPKKEVDFLKQTREKLGDKIL